MRKKCLNCQKEMDDDNVALCMKLYGRDTKKFHCYECISKLEDFPVEKLSELVMYYRKSGCMLFTPLPEELSRNGGIL